MNKVIKNAHILWDHLEEVYFGDLLIEQGRVVQMSERGRLSAYEKRGDYTVIDAKGHCLIPGLIDPQVHFRSPGFEYKEDLKSGAMSAVAGGFTSVLCMPNTSPTLDSPQWVSWIYEESKKRGLCRLFPSGSISKGLLGEELSPMEELFSCGALAFTDDGRGVQKEAVMREAMKKAFLLGVPVLDHAEDDLLSNRGVLHAGEKAISLALPSQSPSSEVVHVVRGISLSKETGCHYHLLHATLKDSLVLMREAKREGASVSLEVSPHHLLLCDEDIVEDDAHRFKMNPPLRSRQDMEALQEAFIKGEIDMVATDHAPHTYEEKSQGFLKAPFGIVGLETSFPLLYTYFVHCRKIKLKKLVDMMTKGPAKLLKLPYGNLKEGSIADLTLMDLETVRTVNPDRFYSKGRNTPFGGRSLRGHALWTMVEGRVVYQREETTL